MCETAGDATQNTLYIYEDTWHKHLLLTDILYGETVVLVQIGDVVLAAELHAVGDPNRGVIDIEEALPFQVAILRTLFPFTVGRADVGREEGAKKINNRWSDFVFFYWAITLLGPVERAVTLTLS